MSAPLRLITAAEVTAALLAPTEGGSALDAEEVAQLVMAMAPAAAAWGRQRQLRLDAYALSHARHDDRPFSWSPLTARRTLGLPAVRSCVWGLASNPSDGVALEVERLEQRLADGRERNGSLAHWLSTAPLGASAQAMSQATAYATELWVAVRWSELGTHPTVGAPDDVVAHPDGGFVLRGRAEVRLATKRAAAHPSGGEVRLLILPGGPTEASAITLGAAALAATLASRDRVPPARMVGLFGAQGQAVVLEVTPSALRRSALGVNARVLQLAAQMQPNQAM